jgi:hypothetical protein
MEGFSCGKNARNNVSVAWIEPENRKVREERKGKFIVDADRVPQGERPINM